MDDEPNSTSGVQSPSPEEVARDFIHSGGVLVPEDSFTTAHRRWPRRLLWAALVVLVVAAAAGVAYEVHHRHHAKGSPAGSSIVGGPAAAQQAANALAAHDGCPASPAARANTMHFVTPVSVTQPGRLYSATVVTTAGTFDISLNSLRAPNTVNDFVFLAQAKYYDCNIFDRANPGQLDQTGDPTGSGIGTPGYTIPDELPPASPTPADQYPLGSVAMINNGTSTQDTSQWFVVTGPSGESLPASYSLVGHVVSGMKVLQTINAEGRPGNVLPLVIQRVLSVTIHSAATG